MSPIELFAIAFAAFSVSTVSGGGAGLLMMPVLGTSLPIAQVPVALSIGTTISSISRIALFARHIQWRVVRRFVPAAIPSTWLGAWMLSMVNPLYLEAALALFLIANLPLLFMPRKRVAPARQTPPYMLGVIGAAAGFVSGLTGAVGVLFNHFYLNYGLTKESVVATRAANEVILHVIKIMLYASFGLLTERVLMYGLLTGGAALVATWSMKKLLPYISELIFKRMSYGAMVLAGAAMLWNAASGIARENHARPAMAQVESLDD